MAAVDVYSRMSVALQDAAASNAHALDEREAMIRTLRDSLARKERGLQVPCAHSPYITVVS